MVMGACRFGDAVTRHLMLRRHIRFSGSSLPKGPCSAISRTFIARLIKGCRGDGHAGFIAFAKTLATSTL
jgi:hypothetical protein